MKVCGHAFNDVVGCPHCDAHRSLELMRITLEQVEDERDTLRMLLDEARDWLCPHEEAAKRFLAHGPRAWCADCHNYLRTNEDVTLIDRINAALEIKG